MLKHIIILRKDFQINNNYTKNLKQNSYYSLLGYMNYVDISSNIGAYNAMTFDLSNNNNKYHYTDTQDPNIIRGYNSPKDLSYVINNDVNELKLYQNSIYITGVIACTTLLITAILISKK